MSTTPPSDPWGTPADRPDLPEPDQPTLDQPASDQPAPDQPASDQPTPEQPKPEEPAADPWTVPPPGPTGEPAATAGFDRPAGNYSATPEPSAYAPPIPQQIPYSEARSRPTPPSSMLTAVKLMYAGAALSAISFLTSLLTRDSARDELAEANPGYTEEQLDTALAFGIALAVIVGLFGILLWVWMAESNRRGKSWARVVATVLGAINIVFTIIGLFIGQNSALVLAFSLLSAGLAAVILYFLYRPDSNAYYEAVSDIRR
jgi:hypothetical protein